MIQAISFTIAILFTWWSLNNTLMKILFVISKNPIKGTVSSGIISDTIAACAWGIFYYTLFK